MALGMEGLGYRSRSSSWMAASVLGSRYFTITGV
jgi:hypothetical protein